MVTDDTNAVAGHGRLVDPGRLTHRPWSPVDPWLCSCPKLPGSLGAMTHPISEIDGPFVAVWGTSSMGLESIFLNPLKPFINSYCMPVPLVSSLEFLRLWRTKQDMVGQSSSRLMTSSSWRSI